MPTADSVHSGASHYVEIMDFQPSRVASVLTAEVSEFMHARVIPNEPTYREQLQTSGNPHSQPPIMEELKSAARDRGLWNLFLPNKNHWTNGLSNVDYAPLAELMGRSRIGPEVFNCSAPDTGNMEILERFGTGAQKEEWLKPLLEGKIRSAFMMTEPAVASSDARNIECTVERDGDDYVINGRKWWITNAGSPECTIAIVMGKSNSGGAPHQQHSQVLVPLDTPGLKVERDLLVLGYNDREGHCEVSLTDVRVPVSSLLGGEGEGFAIAQARLGPGRIHHCMRSVGAAERALELLCARARSRTAFGRPLSEQGVVQDAIAKSRIEIDQARLLTLHAAWSIDTKGSAAARSEIAAIKVVVPNMACRVIDRAIQVHGAAGLSQDFVLAESYAWQRALRIADGPDAVHSRTVARGELAKEAL